MRQKTTSNKETIIAIILAATVAIFRLIPHPANFAPVAAAALAAAVYLHGRNRWLVPMIGLFISDFVIGFYHLPIMLAVYGSFVLIYTIGLTLKKHKSPVNTLIASLSGSILFFIITNFAVWYFGNWYPHNASGLMLSFYLAIPFFRNTLLGDLTFTFALFASLEFIKHYSRTKALSPACKK